jgi:hypothetical protein
MNIGAAIWFLFFRERAIRLMEHLSSALKVPAGRSGGKSWAVGKTLGRFLEPLKLEPLSTSLGRKDRFKIDEDVS